MARRPRIGILYSYNENWIGSTYYIQNLIAAMNLLPDYKQPEVFIITTEYDSFINLKNITKYPYLFFTKLSLFERIINNIFPASIIPSVVRNFFWKRKYGHIEMLFPSTSGTSFLSCRKRVFWIADFQEHFLPSFFTEKEIQRRKKIQQLIADKEQYLILSSENALSNFNDIYPESLISKFVLPFAVTHPPPPELDTSVIKKFSLPSHFFICCNQLWKHKNHEVVLRALKDLKERGVEYFVVFTGKTYDYRNPEYFDLINLKVKEFKLENQVRFLGFIEREDQLALMRNAIAVIQPSLFEGWSTVVEDAKSLRLKLIVSSIEVHKEQLAKYDGRIFFEPLDSVELGKAMEMATNWNIDISYDYRQDMVKYSNSFSDIIEFVTKSNKI